MASWARQSGSGRAAPGSRGDGASPTAAAAATASSPAAITRRWSRAASPSTAASTWAAWPRCAGRDVHVEREEGGRPWTGALALDERPAAPKGSVSAPLEGEHAPEVEPARGHGRGLRCRRSRRHQRARWPHLPRGPHRRRLAPRLRPAPVPQLSRVSGGPARVAHQRSGARQADPGAARGGDARRPSPAGSSPCAAARARRWSSRAAADHMRPAWRAPLLLTPARSGGLDDALLREKLGALGWNAVPSRGARHAGARARPAPAGLRAQAAPPRAGGGARPRRSSGAPRARCTPDRCSPRPPDARCGSGPVRRQERSSEPAVAAAVPQRRAARGRARRRTARGRARLDGAGRPEARRRAGARGRGPR